ncbi:MAG: YtxH domain-containing protein [Bryobacteraceae bacterium]
MRHFLLGLGVGLAGGILLAPKTGYETREYLGQKTDEGLDYVKTRANELGDAASNLVAQGKTAAADVVDKTKSTATDLIDKGKQALGRQPDVQPAGGRTQV